MYISIIATLSRPDAVPLLLKNLKKVCDESHTYEVIIGIDNRQITLDPLLFDAFDLRNLTIFNTGEPMPPKAAINKRRNRIANMHNLIREHLGGSQFVFGFEDDTVLPNDALAYLLEDYKRLNDQANVGMIEGVQIGRWGRQYVGAWKVDDLKNPTQFTTLAYKERKGLEPIDAGGLYCFLTATENYRDTEFKWEEPMGPDVYFGLQLRKKGLNNFIDWSVETGHRNGDHDIYPGPKVEQIRYNLINYRWQNEVGAFK